MRIGIDGRPLQPRFKQHLVRGIGQYAVHLVRALAARAEFEIVVFVDPALPLDPALIPAGVAIRRYPRVTLPLPWRTHWFTQSVVPSTVRRAEVDVFHFLAHGDAPAAGTSGTVVTVHDLILEVMGTLYRNRKPGTFQLMRALERRAILRAERVVVDSACTGHDLTRLIGVPAERIQVAHLGIDERFRPQPESEIAAALAAVGVRRPYLLYVGGFDARKNVRGLLRSYARARAERRDLPRLVLAGPLGPAARAPILDHAQHLGLAGAIEFPGFVSDQHLPGLLSGASLFVFPSLYEGFGFPPLEAMACGAAVVASDGGSLAEVLAQGARLVPAGDDDRFAAAILDTFESPARTLELRELGRHWASRFTWAATAEATAAAYRTAVGSS